MAQFDNSAAEMEVSIYGTNVLPGDKAISVDTNGRVNTNIVAALPTGANTIGNVGLAAAIPTGSNAIGTVGVTSLPALSTGANAIGSVTNFTTAAVLVDASANPTTGLAGSMSMVYNGATWDRLRGDTTNGMFVNVKSMPALATGANTIGNVGLVTGSAVVGKFGIDQTTPGTTNAVQFTNTTIAVTGTFWQATQPVSIATAPVLVAGSAIIGKVGIDQTTNGITNAFVMVDATTPTQKAKVDSSGNVAVALSAALPTGTNTIGAVTSGMAVATSLNAVTAAGSGAASTYSTTRQNFGLQVNTTGSPTVATINLEGTLDGSHWFKLAQWNLSNQATGDIVFATMTPVLGIRANLITLTGGTSPTVTAYLSAI
jgi:hypothetical protein